MQPFDYPVLHDAFQPESHGGTAVDRILAQMREPDPWDYDPRDLRDVQIAAFNERLARRREQIPVLAQRIEQVGVTEVQSTAEMLPFMLSPTTYKSYPGSFVTKGRWDQLVRWLDTVSSRRVTDVDVDGIADIDDFIDRIAAAGHRVVTTSGTTGKTSLLPVSELDVDRNAENLVHAYAVMLGIQQAGPHPLFYTGNRSGSYNGLILLDGLSQAFSTPELTYPLFEERLRVAELSASASLSSSMAKGTTTPSEIDALRRMQARAEVRSGAAMDRFVDAMARHADVPVYLWGQPYAFYLLMQNAKNRGIELEFGPESGIVMAGGLKHHTLPDGYEKELRDFYPSPIRSGYGQSELTALFCECDQGVWHAPPSVIPVLSDLDGRPIEPIDDVAEGVISHFDLGMDGRWGGITTSDWVSMRFAPCPCGLASPAVTACSRVPNPDDDKINCSGRIEMYVRGVLPADG